MIGYDPGGLEKFRRRHLRISHPQAASSILALGLTAVAGAVGEPRDRCRGWRWPWGDPNSWNGNSYFYFYLVDEL